MLTAEQRRAYHDAQRICHVGYGSMALRQELARYLRIALRADACAIGTLDPELGLLTHCVIDGVPVELTRAYLAVAYPEQEAAAVLALGRSGRVVATTMSPIFTSLLESVGLPIALRAVCVYGGMLYGSACFFRERGSRPFTDDEQVLVRHLTPHVAQGLRRAALLDAARQCSESGHAVEAQDTEPGIIALDKDGCLVLRTAAAAGHLEDLADLGSDPEVLPLAVGSALAQLIRGTRDAVSRDSAPSVRGVYVRGRSGRWYTLHAMHGESEHRDETPTIVVIVPSNHEVRSGVLSRLYSLSPRERDVLARLVRGESTKEIAAVLSISPYTVQDHIDSACGKVGVRGRRALLAKLFLDGFEPSHPRRGGDK